MSTSLAEGEDGIVHYQLLRFCQATRLQYLNPHVSLDNQLVMQQQHVDYKIAEALLKKETNNAQQTWALNRRAWVDMVIHLPHGHGDGDPSPLMLSLAKLLSTPLQHASSLSWGPFL
jgi:hypothetical protein